MSRQVNLQHLHQNRYFHDVPWISIFTPDIVRVCFHPDGILCAMVLFNGFIEIWSVSSFQSPFECFPLPPLHGKSSTVDIIWSYSGSRVCIYSSLSIESASKQVADGDFGCLSIWDRVVQEFILEIRYRYLFNYSVNLF